MKLIISLILVIACNLTIQGQTHLTFQNVPINGSVTSFISNLKQKGIKVSTEDNTIDFKLNGVETRVYVNRNQPYSNAYHVTVWYIFPNDEAGYSSQSAWYKKQVARIERIKNIKKTEYYDAGEEEYGFTVYDIPSTTSKKKIGEIHLSSWESNGSSVVSVDYYDNINTINAHYTDYPYNIGGIKWHDFSHLLDDGTQCYLSLNGTNLYVKCKVRISPSMHYTYNLIYQGNDKNTMLWLLNDCNNINIKKDLFNKYLACSTSGIEYFDPKTYIYNDRLDGVTKSYYEEYNKALKAQNINQRRGITSSQFLKLLCPNLFTDKEYEMMDKFLPSDWLFEAGKASSSKSSYDEYLENASFATKQELNMQ